MSGTPTFSGRARFAATRWTMVLAAADSDAGSKSRRALAELAQAYWFPLYAFIRRQGHDPAQAEDFTQDFFARLLEKKSLAQVDPARGRFRSFLLAAAKNFLANESDKARAQKRGGGRQGGHGGGPIALDALDAEARYRIEPVDNMTPERLFEQRWAWAVLDQVLAFLRQQYHDRGQANLFDALKSSLTGAPVPAAGNEELARQLGMSPAALTVAIHRLRRRYRKLLREQIAQTVASPDLVDGEIQYLLSCL